jgi:hypothetical protein
VQLDYRIDICRVTEVDISSTCKVGQNVGVSLPLLTCSPSAWPSRLLYRRGRKSRRYLWITLYNKYSVTACVAVNWSPFLGCSFYKKSKIKRMHSCYQTAYITNFWITARTRHTYAFSQCVSNWNASAICHKQLLILPLPPRNHCCGQTQYQ